jgi:hypothetical protein
MQDPNKVTKYCDCVMMDVIIAPGRKFFHHTFDRNLASPFGR